MHRNFINVSIEILTFHMIFTRLKVLHQLLILNHILGTKTTTLSIEALSPIPSNQTFTDVDSIEDGNGHSDLRKESHVAVEKVSKFFSSTQTIAKYIAKFLSHIYTSTQYNQNLLSNCKVPFPFTHSK